MMPDIVTITLSPLPTHRYTEHCMAYKYLLYSIPLVDVVSPLHWYRDSRHYYYMFGNYWYTDTLPSCAQLLHVLTPLLYRLTGIHALIVYVCLLHGSWIYSCCIDHGLYDCYMHRHVFSLHDYFLLLILIFPLLDTWAVDMRCVESHIYCSRFPLLCFVLSTELMSCYRVTCTMFCTCSWYTV